MQSLHPILGKRIDLHIALKHLRSSDYNSTLEKRSQQQWLARQARKEFQGQYIRIAIAKH